MTTADKKQPAYTDLDPMPFGKFKDKLLQDVPGSYLIWLWSQRPLSDTKLENYIHNSMDALKMEDKDYVHSRYHS